MNNLKGKYIWHYRYNYNDGSADRMKQNSYYVDRHQVVLESETEIVVDNLGFKVIQKECDCQLSLNRPIVVLDIEDKSWGNGVIFSLYSTVELTADVIKVVILGEINQKLKFLGVTGLDIIKRKVNEVVL